MRINSRGARFAKWAVLCAAVALSTPARVAWAQPVDDDTRARARSLGEEGNALFDRGDFAGALDRYQRAAALVSVPTLGLKMARSLERLHRLVEASERYLAVTRMTLPADALDVHREAVASAETERAALLPRIPNLVLRVAGSAPSRVTLDGKELPAAVVGVKVPADPGRHRVEARRGDAVDAQDVTLAEGQTLEVALDPRGGATSRVVPPGAGSPVPSWWSAHHVVGVGLLGVGVVGLAVGAGVGGAAAGKKGDLEKTCGADLQCPPASHADADDYNGMRTISTVGFIAGGALAAAGVVLIVVPNSKGGAKEAALHVGPTSVSFRGSF